MFKPFLPVNQARHIIDMTSQNLKSVPERLLRSRILDIEEWGREVSSLGSGYCTFQTPAWVEFLKDQTRSAVARIYDFEFVDGTRVTWPLLQVPTGRLARRFVAMPYGLYGNPIISGRWSPQKGKEILSRILKGRNLQLTCVTNPLEEEIEFFLPSGVTAETTPGETHFIELTRTWEDTWNHKFTHRIRRQVNVGSRAGLLVRQGNSSAQDIGEFYRLYTKKTVDWGYETPPYPIQFFSALFNGEPKAKLLFAEHQGRNIGAVIYVEDNDSVLIWFSVTDKEEENLFPGFSIYSHLAHMTVDQGKKYINLGASNSLEGVRRFKELWHAQSKPYKIITYKRQLLVKGMDMVVNTYKQFLYLNLAKSTVEQASSSISPEKTA